jgi:hypothetical protein
MRHNAHFTHKTATKDPVNLFIGSRPNNLKHGRLMDISALDIAVGRKRWSVFTGRHM